VLAVVDNGGASSSSFVRCKNMVRSCTTCNSIATSVTTLDSTVPIDFSLNIYERSLSSTSSIISSFISMALRNKALNPVAATDTSTPEASFKENRSSPLHMLMGPRACNTFDNCSSLLSAGDIELDNYFASGVFRQIKGRSLNSVAIGITNDTSTTLLQKDMSENEAHFGTIDDSTNGKSAVSLLVDHPSASANKKNIEVSVSSLSPHIKMVSASVAPSPLPSTAVLRKSSKSDIPQHTTHRVRARPGSLQPQSPPSRSSSIRSSAAAAPPASFVRPALRLLRHLQAERGCSCAGAAGCEDLGSRVPSHRNAVNRALRRLVRSVSRPDVQFWIGKACPLSETQKRRLPLHAQTALDQEVSETIGASFPPEGEPVHPIVLLHRIRPALEQTRTAVDEFICEQDVSDPVLALHRTLRSYNSILSTLLSVVSSDTLQEKDEEDPLRAVLHGVLQLRNALCVERGFFSGVLSLSEDERPQLPSGLLYNDLVLCIERQQQCTRHVRGVARRVFEKSPVKEQKAQYQKKIGTLSSKIIEESLFMSEEMKQLQDVLQYDYDLSKIRKVRDSCV